MLRHDLYRKKFKRIISKFVAFRGYQILNYDNCDIFGLRPLLISYVMSTSITFEKTLLLSQISRMNFFMNYQFALSPDDPNIVITFFR